MSEKISLEKKNVVAIPPIAPIPANYTGDHSQPDSSIGPSPKIEARYAPSKPVLEEPKAPVMRALGSMRVLEKLADDFMFNNQDKVNAYIARMNTLDEQEAEKMKETIQRTQDAGFWSYLRDIGSMIMAAISSVFGLSILASGGAPLVGAALVASGILAIFNFTLKESGAWDWVAKQLANDNEELRKKLATLLPAVVSLVCMVIGIAGTVGASMFVHLDTQQKLLKIGEMVMLFANIFLWTTEGINDNFRCQLESALTLLRTENQVMRLKLQNAMTQMQDVCQNQNELTEVAAQIVRTTTRAVQSIHQAV